MKYIVEEPKRRRFTEDRVSKHHKILRELPADIDTRIANIHRRNEILKANKHYQLKIERDRAYAALQSMPRMHRRTCVSSSSSITMASTKRCKHWGKKELHLKR
jgi:hypothetical protein